MPKDLKDLKEYSHGYMFSNSSGNRVINQKNLKLFKKTDEDVKEKDKDKDRV